MHELSRQDRKIHTFYTSWETSVLSVLKTAFSLEWHLVTFSRQKFLIRILVCHLFRAIIKWKIMKGFWFTKKSKKNSPLGCVLHDTNITFIYIYIYVYICVFTTSIFERFHIWRCWSSSPFNWSLCSALSNSMSYCFIFSNSTSDRCTGAGPLNACCEKHRQSITACSLLRVL